jgi:hypothetical protein
MKDLIEGITLATTLQLYLQIAAPMGYLGILLPDWAYPETIRQRWLFLYRCVSL